MDMEQSGHERGHHRASHLHCGLHHGERCPGGGQRVVHPAGHASSSGDTLYTSLGDAAISCSCHTCGGRARVIAVQAGDTHGLAEG